MHNDEEGEIFEIDANKTFIEDKREVLDYLNFPSQQNLLYFIDSLQIRNII